MRFTKKNWEENVVFCDVMGLELATKPKDAKHMQQTQFAYMKDDGSPESRLERLQYSQRG